MDNKKKVAKKEKINWEDVAKRAMADLENYKKQAEKDRFEILNIMKAASLAKFMEVYDDLKRSLDFIKDKEAKAGVVGVQKKFRDLLTSEGLETIEFKKGEEFDPEFAEAVSHEDNEVGAGKVIETTEVGLKYKDRVIKPAKVRVGKGKAHDFEHERAKRVEWIFQNS